MKNLLLRNLVGALMVTLIFIGSTLVDVSGQELNDRSATNLAADTSKRSIQGVWLTQVQVRNCQTGDPIGQPGRGLLTFAFGGTLSETTAPGAAAQFFRGPGHGLWDRLDSDDYTAAIMIPRLNADGSFAGWSRFRATFQLIDGGNQLVGTGSFEILAPNGTVLATGCSTSTGTRFE